MPSFPARTLAAGPVPASPGTASDPVEWLATRWDDPRVATLHQEMDEEIRPRYVAPGAALTSFPPAPTSDQVPVAWLALVGGRAAATASLRLLEVPGEIRRWEVKRVFVSPAFRRRGLAAEVLRRVEESAVERGAEHLVLQTGDRQPEAITLYEREGWRRIPVFPPYDTVRHSVCFTKPPEPSRDQGRS